MENAAILQADLLDIIFEGRNKEYGAYELRRTYHKRMRIAVAVMLSLILLFCLGQLIAGNLPENQSSIPFDDSVMLTKVDMPEEPPMPPPPKVEPPPPQKFETIKVTTPRIAPDEQVPETEMPPVEDQENAKIALVTQKGDPDNGSPVGPPDDGNRGIIEKPKEREEDNGPLIHVEIESEYPGGKAAWERFLIQNLRYPPKAEQEGVQGFVIVQFIVDKEGNVSDIKAISGPEELRAEAVRVIKKSGKWKPAIQNGHQVPSYKKQPIGFKLEQQ